MHRIFISGLVLASDIVPASSHEMSASASASATAAADRKLQDPDLRGAAGLLQRALNAETVQEEEQLWTEVG